MSKFDFAFARVIGHEGGYVNDPKDPGGETKFGVSKRSYPGEDIKNLTVERAKEIYRRDFWDKLRADELPAELAEFLFDYAINSGEDRAAMALQGAVGVLRDGNIGPKTLDAVRAKRPYDVLRLLFVDRAMIFALAPDGRDARYGAGWFARLFDKTALALKGA